MPIQHHALSIRVEETDDMVARSSRIDLSLADIPYHQDTFHVTVSHPRLHELSAVTLGRRMRVVDYALPRPCCFDVMTLRSSGGGGEKRKVDKCSEVDEWLETRVRSILFWNVEGNMWTHIAGCVIRAERSNDIAKL